MPSPTAITDLSQVAVSNFPAGGDSPANLDDVQRAQASFIAMLRDGKGFSGPVTLASAATTDIGGQNSLAVEIGGTTGITSFGTNYNGPRYLRFTGALLLTHNATTLNLPGAANITTAAGDTCIAYPNSALNGWNVVQFQRVSVTPFTIGTGLSITSGVLNSTSKVINVVEATPYTTYTSTGAGIPNDNTIPQITEGIELMTVAITPTSATSRLRIEFLGNFGGGSGTYGIAALFQDSTANALAASSNGTYDSANMYPIEIAYEMAAGTTSATTFRIRVGSGASTLYINGNSAERKFGGVTRCTLRVTEIAA
jgi:hypothetical protein